MPLKKKNVERKAPVVVIDQKKVDEAHKQEIWNILVRHNCFPKVRDVNIVYANEAMPNPLSGDSVE